MLDRVKKVASGALALAALALPAGAVDWLEDVQILQPWEPDPVVTVRSDGERYTSVEGESVPYTVYISGSCTSLAKADQSDIWIYRDDGSNYRAETIDWGWDSRHESGTYDLAVGLRAGEKQRVVAACNAHLDELVGQGQSARDVLEASHVIDGPSLYRARHTFSCTGNLHLTGEGDYAELDLANRVRCKKSPPGSFPEPPQPPLPGSGDLAQVFGVTAAQIEVDPEQATVYSEADLTVQGSITGNGKGTVRFRVNHNGGLGPISTLSFAKAGPQPVSFPLTVRCPQEGDQEAPSGGGIGGLTAAPSNVKNGTVRLEIVSPTGGVERSNVAAYSVTCKETGTLATPLPDLTIVDVRGGGAGRAASVKAIVRVRNIGAAGAPATLVRAQRPGAAPTEAPVPALAAGDAHDVEVLMPAAGRGESAVLFRVDPANAVQESHEGNNTYTH